MHALAGCDVLDSGQPILLRFVVNHKLGPVLLGQRALLGPTCRADGSRAEPAQHLAQEQADPARGRVAQHPLAPFDFVALLHQAQRRHAHEEGAERILVRDPGRDLDRLLGRRRAVLGIAARAHPDDAVADLEARVPVGVCDGPGGFLADNHGQAGARITEPLAWKQPAKVFLTRIWCGCRLGTGASLMYSNTDGGPVLGVRTAAMVVGRVEVDIVPVWRLSSMPLDGRPKRRLRARRME